MEKVLQAIVSRYLLVKTEVLRNKLKHYYCYCFPTN